MRQDNRPQPRFGGAARNLEEYVAVINSVNFLVKRMFDNFDANRDGVLDRKSEHQTTLEEEDGNWTTVTRYSLERSLKAADADQDNLVTRMEMDTFVRSYDTNQNGRLDVSIRDLFKRSNHTSEFGKFLLNGGPEVIDRTYR
jgi:hypothetical protein